MQRYQTGYTPRAETKIHWQSQSAVGNGIRWHMGMDSSQRILRQRTYFLDLDRMVERTIGSCLAYQASKRHYQEDPVGLNRIPSDL